MEIMHDRLEKNRKSKDDDRRAAPKQPHRAGEYYPPAIKEPGASLVVRSRHCELSPRPALSKHLVSLCEHHRLHERVQWNGLLYHASHQLSPHGVGKNTFFRGVGERARQ
jgi:hypothetical protein